MIFPNSEISKHLSSLGLVSSDTMIHGDSGVAAQDIFDKLSDPFNSFLNIVLNYFNEGNNCAMFYLQCH